MKCSLCGFEENEANEFDWSKHNNYCLGVAIRMLQKRLNAPQEAESPGDQGGPCPGCGEIVEWKMEVSHLEHRHFDYAPTLCPGKPKPNEKWGSAIFPDGWWEVINVHRDKGVETGVKSGRFHNLIHWDIPISEEAATAICLAHNRAMFPERFEGEKAK